MLPMPTKIVISLKFSFIFILLFTFSYEKSCSIQKRGLLGLLIIIVTAAILGLCIGFIPNFNKKSKKKIFKF
jgi:hypothetical protein